jgi:hypothetical protein
MPRAEDHPGDPAGQTSDDNEREKTQGLGIADEGHGLVHDPLLEKMS